MSCAGPDDEHLLARNTFIGDLYNEFQQEQSRENFLRVLVANYILEGIYFYSGFMFFYNLGRMPGSVQEIHYINRDENTHLWLFRNILRDLRAEEPDLFTAESEEMMREMIREGVRQEIAWGKYAIGNEVEGLNEKMIEDYVRCLGALYEGYEEEPSSMRWVSQYANPNFIKTDFIEGRSTAYAKSTAFVDDL